MSSSNERFLGFLARYGFDYKDTNGYALANCFRIRREDALRLYRELAAAHAPETGCDLCAMGMNSFTDPDTGNRMHARNGTVTLCSAQKANEQANTPRFSPAIEAEGMTWWNACTEAERAHWLKKAGSAAPADAWQAFRTSSSESEV